MGDYGRFMFRRPIVVEDIHGLEMEFGPDEECVGCGSLADGVLAYTASWSGSAQDKPIVDAEPLCENCASDGKGKVGISEGVWESFRRSAK